MRLGRFDEARAAFAKALNLCRRYSCRRISSSSVPVSPSWTFAAVSTGAPFGRSPDRPRGSPLASKSEIAFSRLYVAECHARLGSYGPMATEIEALREERQENPFAPSPALGELFMSLDQGVINADLIAHVREYLQDEENGVKRAYRPLRRAGAPGS